MTFYKDSEMGAVKVIVYKDGEIRAWAYRSGAWKPTMEDGIPIDPDDAEVFAAYLWSHYDRHDKYNKLLIPEEIMECSELDLAEFRQATEDDEEEEAW